jgi:alkylresorcinol/alkylpyrone synthase
MVSAHLSSIAAAMPPAIRQQSMWDECFAARYAALTGARRIWNGAGVQTRHAAIDPRIDDVSSWSTAARMRRYLPEAVPLAKRAVTDALIAADVLAAEIDLLVTVSCTGYATPGLDLMLAHELAMPSTLQRLNIGHMGCYAALPGLAAAGDAAVARGMTALLVCVELTSLHVQPPDRDIEQLISHALFSDAAVAVVLRPAGPGLRLIDTAVCTDASHQTAMTWHITDLGFRMTLSPRVPAALATSVGPTVEALLRRNGLDCSDIAGWAIHPGGPRILDVCARALALDDDAMAPSRETLRDHGNCSSGTVLLVLERLLQQRSLDAGDHVVALAFGPGLTLYAALLQWT